MATVLENPLIPHWVKFGDGDKIRGLNPRQAVFLADERRDVFYGGAGGGGKSVALLLAAAQYATEPNYKALILRRTYAQLSEAGSILNQAREWWCGMPGVSYHATEHQFTFSSGALIRFGHMNDDKAVFNYQGAVYDFIGYDELPQFKEPMFTYLFTRQRRRIDSAIPLRMRSSGNPGGIGHKWVYDRFINDKTRLPGCGFVPARLSDNWNLDQQSYIDSFAYSDALTRSQVLDGNWLAVKGTRFKEEWFRRYHYDGPFLCTPDGERFLPHTRTVFQTCDPSASAKKTADHFVLSTWCVSPKGNLVWLGCSRDQIEIPEQLKAAQSEYLKWKPQFVGVEEVLNQRALAQWLRRSTEPAMVVRSLSPRGTDKVGRAAGAMAHAESGRVLLPAPREAGDFPLDDVLLELVTFTGEKGGADDIVDTLSYACEELPKLSQPAGRPGVVTPGQGPPPPTHQAPAPPRPGAKSPEVPRPGSTGPGGPVPVRRPAAWH